MIDINPITKLISTISLYTSTCRTKLTNIGPGDCSSLVRRDLLSVRTIITQRSLAAGLDDKTHARCVTSKHCDNLQSSTSVSHQSSPDQLASTRPLIRLLLSRPLIATLCNATFEPPASSVCSTRYYTAPRSSNMRPPTALHSARPSVRLSVYTLATREWKAR